MHQEPVLHTLSELVRIPSVNPAYEGGVSEAGVVAWLREFCRSRGIETWETEVFPGRPNLLARLPGRDPKRRIVLEAHTDTVSVKGMTIPPFEPIIDGNLLYGRGSCDTKAGLAAMLHAMVSLKDEGFVPPCEVWLAAVVDEEYSYRGVVKLCEGLTAHAAIVAEPTELRLVVASKGVLRWRIRVRGKAAHSSKPHLGVNAINHMARLILALEEDEASIATKVHPLAGAATCNVGVISGGVQVNFVPDECVIEIDRRLLPGEKATDALTNYQSLLDDLARRHPGFIAEMEPPMLTDEGLDTPGDAPPALLGGEILREMGLNGDPIGVPFGSDASKLSRQGVPSLVFGPGSIDRAHGAVEYVEIDEVLKAEAFFREFLRRFE
jgi:acetylornithine deacetylase/succinyl-diaminopimelate desuccinylase family protein